MGDGHFYSATGILFLAHFGMISLLNEWRKCCHLSFLKLNKKNLKLSQYVNIVQ